MTLGYIYYELSSYEQALKYLEAISPTFYDYPAVLLAIGWASLKSNNYRKALVALDKFVRKYPDDLNVEEAHFVMGQCYLKLGYYRFAIKEYEEIIKKHPIANHFAARVKEIRTQLKAEEERVERLKTEFLLLESKLLNTIPVRSGDGVPEYVRKERQKIQKEREALLQKLVEEREVFLTVSETIAALKRNLEKRVMRKDWRAYAEYGRSRAMFLKGLSEH